MSRTSLLRGHDFQYFDGRALVTINNTHSAVINARPIEVEPGHHGRTRGHAEIGRRLDAAQHLVINQNAAQRRLAKQDFLAHRLAAIAEIDARNAKLDDLAALVQGEENLADVEVA